MLKIKKRAKKQRHHCDPDDAPSRSAPIISNAIRSGRLDIMKMDLHCLPDHVIEALSDNEDKRCIKDQIDTGIIIYDKYLLETQKRGIKKKDMKELDQIVFAIMIMATLEKAKRLGFIRSYSAEPNIFSPDHKIGCDFGDNKFFQGADMYRLMEAVQDGKDQQPGDNRQATDTPAPRK